MNNKPFIAITMGDPAGIGPEIILKAFLNDSLYEQAIPFVVGDLKILKFFHSLNAMKSLEFRTYDSFEKLEADKDLFEPGVLPVLDLDSVNIDTYRPSEISAQCGRAAFSYIETAIELALAGKVAANVSGPICKASLNNAGYNYPGHTEIYAEKTDSSRYLMTLFTDTIKVAHLTCHMSMREMFDYITIDNIEWAVELLYNTFVRMGVAKPRIGVCALNPHASEKGLFGNEEETIIRPAVVQLRKKGIGVSGPFPADTIFAKAKYGKFDIILAMYHDQGHIAVKTLNFEKSDIGFSFSGVNITLGLPIIRTSVDHGTAFDIVGKNVASEKSLLQAYDLACSLMDK